MLKGSLQLVILHMLAERPMANWELLDEIYTISGMLPEEIKFKRTVQLLVDEGFITVSTWDSRPSMSLTPLGAALLARLERIQDCVRPSK